MASARSVLDREQMRKAVAALMKYIGKEKAESKELFDDDEFLYVVRVHCGPQCERRTQLHMPGLARLCATRRLLQLSSFDGAMRLRVCIGKHLAAAASPLSFGGPATLSPQTRRCCHARSS